MKICMYKVKFIIGKYFSQCTLYTHTNFRVIVILLMPVAVVHDVNDDDFDHGL